MPGPRPITPVSYHIATTRNPICGGLRAPLCEYAPNFGSDSLLVQVSRVDSGGTDETGFEQIEFGTAIHLPFHQFELGDLAFRLTV
jgi:hypothetical protein